MITSLMRISMLTKQQHAAYEELLKAQREFARLEHELYRQQDWINSLTEEIAQYDAQIEALRT